MVSVKTLEQRLKSWQADNLPEWLRAVAPAIIEQIKQKIRERQSQQSQ